jgi:hypothetical protein
MDSKKGSIKSSVIGMTFRQTHRPEHFDKTSLPLGDMVDKASNGRARGGRDFEPGRPSPVGSTDPQTEETYLPMGVGEMSASIEPK